MREFPRRRVLQALGGLATTSVAGCAATDETAPPRDGTTTTDAPTTSTSSTKTTDASTPEPIATEAWTVDSFDGDVEGLWLPNRPRKPNTTGGPLYVGTMSGTVADLSVATGEVRWEFSVAGELGNHGYPNIYSFGQTLLVVSDTRNRETLRNYVEKVDPASGHRQWTFEEREFITPLGVVDDTLYLAGEYIKAPPEELGPNQNPAGEGRFHAVDLETGEERWRTTVQSLINATVARHGIYANVSSDDDASEHTLVAFDRDGTERWRKPAGLYHLPEPVTVEDGVLASVQYDSVASIAPDGTERWHVSEWKGGPSQIEVTPERIYVGSEPLIAVSRTGTEHWRLDEYGGIVRPIRDQRREKTLYVEQGTKVSAIDSEEGTKRWSFDPEHEKYVHVQAVVDDGLVIDTGIRGRWTFSLLDEMTGDVLGDFSTGKPYRNSIAVASRLFVGASGTVYAFDVGA